MRHPRLRFVLPDIFGRKDLKDHFAEICIGMRMRMIESVREGKTNGARLNIRGRKS